MKRFLCVVMAMLLFCTWAFAEEESVPGAEEVALGLQYENGDRVEQDYAKAMEYYLSAAEAGNGEGMRRVGRLYQYGNGVESDYALAMEWYVRGAEAGDAGSIRNIGYLYENGFGVEQDYAVAMEWYLKAAEAGEPKAMNDIGYLYENGLGVEQDYSLAMEWYLKAAEMGNADAMCYIGWLYSFGLGVEQDDTLALAWYLRAAEAGSADGMFNAGVYYYLGRGVEQDVSLAAEWFLKAAEAGHPSAMCNVGAAYANGEGVEQDPEKAAEWYRKSAEAGDARGMCLYAQKLEKGEGVEQDVKAAAEWYRKSAEAGDAEAMYYYALMLDDSEGVEKNAVIVAEWYLQAAEAGIPEAMYRYAQMLENGVGVEKNEALAREWYDKAKEAGYIPLPLSQTALAEPSERLKAFYSALVDGWEFQNEEGTCAEYGDGFLQVELTDSAIVITETLDEGEPLTWTFVQEGDWLTAPLGPDEDEGRSIAYWLLNDAISAQGVKTDLFLGYINALSELQGKYLTYDESDGEKKVSVNIAGPYEYDLDAMEGLAISEAYLLEEGWKPLLGEDYEMISLSYGKVKVFGIATKDGVYVTISEYGGLDDLAFQAIVSFVKVLQPKGWENFIAEYTELKDAETADFTAKVNLDEAGMEDTWMKYKEGYGFANFIIGDNILDE